VVSAIDEYFFGPLLREINLKECIVCVTSDHATPCALKVHSDTPVPILISGGKTTNDNKVKFSEKECAKGSLGVIDHGFKLMPKLMEILKQRK